MLCCLLTAHLTQNGATPVFIAAQINANPKLMELLLNNGGDPNKTTNVSCSFPMYLEIIVC